VIEQQERHRLRSVLDRYVSPNVASVIIQQDRDAFTHALRGDKRPVAVLFSDIRSFTSWSEKLDPVVLVEQLNEYFAGTVQAVLDEQGTLQKYIGDALMAVWGDTHSHGPAEDCRRALRAALGMQAALNRLNARWTATAQRSVLSTGIGLNHGEAVVGNLGHPQRMEFTVLGDAVNFAARLESATKQFHQTLLVSDSVRQLAGDTFIFRCIDKLKVKGKAQPMEVFTVLGEKPATAEPDWLAQYHHAIALFRDRQFESATASFEQLTAGPLPDDYLCLYFLRRCAEVRANPPPDNWDTAYELTEK
jgi:adenylate cyclase